MSIERRNFSRVPFQHLSHIIKGEKILPASIADISLKGALILPEGESDLKVGDDCLLNISLAQDTVAMNIRCEVVYAKDATFGLRFREIELEDLTHLRRLVELNLGDSGQVVKELFFLIGQP